MRAYYDPDGSPALATAAGSHGTEIKT